jgi:hypothetical protein
VSESSRLQDLSKPNPGGLAWLAHPTKSASGRTESGATLWLLKSANLPPGWRSGRIKDVCMAGRLRDREISPIQDVEKLCAELHAEVFRDSLDGVIFEQGEIQVRQSWPSQNITSGVAAKIEALGKSAEGGVTICRIEGGRRRRRDRKALGLDVVVGIPGIYERSAMSQNQRQSWSDGFQQS